MLKVKSLLLYAADSIDDVYSAKTTEEAVELAKYTAKVIQDASFLFDSTVMAIEEAEEE